MVKAACQCKGRDAAMAVVRILGPPSTQTVTCRPQTSRPFAIKSHRGKQLVTQLPQGLKLQRTRGFRREPS
jgi:hypothetical protein